MAVDYKLNADELRAIKNIQHHAETVANRKVNGQYAKHDPSDPQVRKLADKYVDEVHRTIYQRAHTIDGKPATAMNDDFTVSGPKSSMKLRSTTHAKVFDIPESWTKKEGSRSGEQWTAKDLGL